jgi:hypothetical protein
LCPNAGAALSALLNCHLLYLQTLASEDERKEEKEEEEEEDALLLPALC